MFALPTEPQQISNLAIGAFYRLPEIFNLNDFSPPYRAEVERDLEAQCRNRRHGIQQRGKMLTPPIFECGKPSVQYWDVICLQFSGDKPPIQITGC